MSPTPDRPENSDFAHEGRGRFAESVAEGTPAGSACRRRRILAGHAVRGRSRAGRGATGAGCHSDSRDLRSANWRKGSAIAASRPIAASPLARHRHEVAARWHGGAGFSDRCGRYASLSECRGLSRVRTGPHRRPACFSPARAGNTRRGAARRTGRKPASGALHRTRHGRGATFRRPLLAAAPAAPRTQAPAGFRAAALPG